MELDLNHLPDDMVLVSGFGGEHTGGLELDAVSQVDLYPITADLVAE
jgi:hypothetical protein